MSPFNPDLLRRRPDVEAPELVAVDAADRLLLDTAADRHGPAGGIATINDSYGALTLGAADLTGGTGVRAFQDGIVNERALALNAADQGMDGSYRSCPLDATLLDGVSTVLLRLPRSLDELDEIAWTIAAHGQPDVQVLAGGRLKHMSLSMNAVLGRYFDDVTAGLARQKSRVLVAASPRPVAGPAFPRSARYDVGLGRPLELRAYGATFGGAALDPGTELLHSPTSADWRPRGAARSSISAAGTAPSPPTSRWPIRTSASMRPISRRPRPLPPWQRRQPTGWPIGSG